ncbi:hypothetical protein MGWOODY_Smn2229 [hydrothermal vent metagenome]|uniref:Uncharacterized protein n=1 Tax=hydrothermal vent metagenome TaxID=652676 RepID=A0A170PPP5_9ZZZZ
MVPRGLTRPLRARRTGDSKSWGVRAPFFRWIRFSSEDVAHAFDNGTVRGAQG